MSFHTPNKYRVRSGVMATDDAAVGYGVFFLPMAAGKPPLRCIADDGVGVGALTGWEHVSVSLPNRCPTWAEMDRVKGLFWDDEDPVMQLHPPRSQWVNCHPYCLHLWRPIGVAIPLPPPMLVGPVTG
jgi:hypothetical protein